MRKILAKGNYAGEFNGIAFEKAVVIYSENNQYPKMESIDKGVYEMAEAKYGTLVGKDVEMNYQERYGKYKVVEIKVPEQSAPTGNDKPFMKR